MIGEEKTRHKVNHTEGKNLNQMVMNSTLNKSKIFFISQKDYWCLTLIIFILPVSLVNKTFAQNILPQKGLCAHRGSSVNYPENTIPAFQEAIFVGAQMIEMDPRMTKDSVLVLMHDERVDRTTNGKGFVRNITLSEIKKLDAGEKKDKSFIGVSVPTFEEALSIMPKNIWINCHTRDDVAAAVEATKIIAKLGRLHQAFLACSHKAAEAARKTDSRIMICNMDDQTEEPGKYLLSSKEIRANFMQFWPYKYPLTGNWVAAAKKEGIRINYFQSGEIKPNDLKRLFDEGIQFILVNNIDEMMPIAKKCGVEPVQPQF